MFRDESNHVIKKANKRTNDRGAVKKTTTTKPSKPSTTIGSKVASRIVPQLDSYPNAAPSSTSTSTQAPIPPPSDRTPPLSASSSTASFSARPSLDHTNTHYDGAIYNTEGSDTEPHRDTLATSVLSLLTPKSGRSSPRSECSDDTIDIPESDLSRVIYYSPSRSIQERGTAFFFSRYVAVDFGCYQNYGFVYDVWKPPTSEAGKVDCVTASMMAVGLTGLSKVRRCSETMYQARRSYGTALQLTNAALQDPAEAIKDSTMLSILILSTYEFISGRTPQTMQAWQDHVNGAAALTRMRGTRPFKTKSGTRMFLMLCHSVLISCIQGGLPMPQSMLELRQELGLFTNIKNPTWRIVDPICRALQVRHDIKQGTLTDTDDIVARLVDVEDEFAKIVEEMPERWHYRCAQVLRPNSAVLGSWCHIYPGFAEATTWNGMRTMRILTQETILEQLCRSMARTPCPPMRHQILLVKAMKMLELLGEAVIASVPQHFGIVSSRDAMPGHFSRPDFVPASRPPSRLVSACPIPSPKPERRGSFEAHSPVSTPRPTLLDPTQSDDGRSDAERFMTLASASNTIVWPLYTLGMSSSCTRETRQYIIDRLGAIHMETGLEQARSVRALLESKGEIMPWESICISTESLPQIPDNEFPTMV